MDKPLYKIKSYLKRDKRASLLLLQQLEAERDEIDKQIKNTQEIIKLLIDMINNLKSK